jgi:hypothetical protein
MQVRVRAAGRSAVCVGAAAVFATTVLVVVVVFCGRKLIVVTSAPPLHTPPVDRAVAYFA